MSLDLLTFNLCYTLTVPDFSEMSYDRVGKFSPLDFKGRTERLLALALVVVMFESSVILE